MATESEFNLPRKRSGHWWHLSCSRNCQHLSHVVMASSINKELLITNRPEKKEKLVVRGNEKSEFLMWHFILEKKAFTYT